MNKGLLKSYPGGASLCDPPQEVKMRCPSAASLPDELNAESHMYDLFCAHLVGYYGAIVRLNQTIAPIYLNGCGS